MLGGEKAAEGIRRKLRKLAAQIGSPKVEVLATYGFTEAKMAWAECPCRVDEPLRAGIISIRTSALRSG